MKEHDYFLEAINNPTFSTSDFLQVGLSAENTSFESKDKYKSLEYIQQHPLFQTNEKFDEVKFDKAYLAAADGFKHLTQEDYNTGIANQFSYFRDNILAPKEYKRQGPEYTIGRMKFDNPKRQKISAWGYNAWSDPTMSDREIAESNKTYDVVTNQWIDSPNDQGFLGNLKETKVLAQYDYDVDINGNQTNDPSQAVHHKGELKLNYKGQPYYETLGDRSVYGRQVLSAFNTITVDGSDFNKFDFFDSDDLDKSTAGTLVKDIIKVAPAFIPYVGPWYLAARVTLEASNLFAKMGKMFSGGDNETFSKMEGFYKSMTLDQSDFANEHPWRLENMLNMSADVFTQLAEQRWMFQYLPSILQGNSLGWSKKAREAFRTAEIEKNMQASNSLVQSIEQLEGSALDLKKIMSIKQNQIAQATLSANNKLEQVLKNNYTLGKYIGRTYMTGITTAETYAEAREQGASNMEAALLTLGYSLAEYGLLSTNLGEWFLPELRLEKQRIKRLINEIHGIHPTPSSTASKGEKISWAKKIINMAKNFFDGTYTLKPETSSVALTAEHLFANAIGEGFEETSEEMLQDFAKSIYNVYSYLSGSESHIRPTWEDEEGNINIMNTLNDYALNFVGGFIGGGIGQMHQSYKQARSITNLGPNSSAFQELLYLVRNGQADDIIKTSKKMMLADPNLSANVNSAGVFESGTKTNNQNIAAQTEFERYVRNLEHLLNSVGAVDQTQLLNDLALKEIRFSKLLNSTVAASYSQQYHSLVADTVAKYEQIQNIQNDKKDDSSQLTEQQQQEISKLQSEIDENKKKIQEYIDGTQGKEFVRDATFEMDDDLALGYIPNNIVQYIYMREDIAQTRRRIEQIPKEELDKYKTDWAAFKASELPDRIRTMRKIFDKINVKVSDKILNFANIYFGRSNERLEGYEGDALLLESDIINEKDATTQFNGYEQFLGKKYSDITRDVIMTKMLADRFDTRYDMFIQLLDTIMSEEASNIIDDDSLQTLLTSDSLPSTKGYLSEEFRDIQSLRVALNDEGKRNIIAQKLVEDIKNDLINDDYQHLIDYIEDVSYLKTTVKEYLRDYVNRSNASQDIKDKINSSIDKVKSSPFDQLIDEFQISLDDPNMKVSDLLKFLESQLQKGLLSSNLNDFGYNDPVQDAINNALQLIKIVHSHLAAARVDNARYTDPFGYNIIVNEFENAGLAEIDEQTYNILQEDLAKTQTELLFYQRLYQVNSGQKIEKEQKVAIKLIQNHFVKTSNFFTQYIPDTWLGKGDLIQIIADLRNGILGRLEAQDDIQSMSDEDEIKLRHDYTVYANAVGAFFNKNQDRDLGEIFTVDNFAEIVSLNDDEVSLDTQYGKQFSHRSFINWIAAVSTIRYDRFEKMYLDILDDKFLPLSGQMNLLYHELAFTQSKFWFNKFADTINVIVSKALELNSDQNPIIDGRLQDHLEVQRLPNAGLNTHVHVRWKNTFLAEGAPGTGKSTANYIYYLKLQQKNDSNVLKKIFVVHRTLKGAQRIIKELVDAGFNKDQFVPFTHQGYLRYINSSYTVPNIINGKYEIDPNTVEEYDDQTYHYINEGAFNKGIEIPSLVIVDEITNMGELDISLHDRFIQEQNISSIVTGDFTQSTAIGSFVKDGSLQVVSPYRNGFSGTGRLATSMRTNNLINDDNIKEIGDQNEKLIYDTSEQIRGSIDEEGNYDIESSEIHITYENIKHVERDDGLYGIKFTESLDDESKNTINIMLSSLGENDKLSFIYTDPTSELYTYLNQLNESGEFKDKIVFKQGSAQGDEGKYYIVEMPNIDDIFISSQSEAIEGCISYLRNFYTSISRAAQGTLVFYNESQRDYIDLYLHSKEVESEGVFVIDQQQRKEANERIKNVISEAVKDIESDASNEKRDRAITTTEEGEPSTEEGEEDSFTNTGDGDVTNEDIEENSDEFHLPENDRPGVTNGVLHSFNTFDTGVIVTEKNELIFSPKAIAYIDEQLKKPLFERDFEHANITGLMGLALIFGYDVFGGIDEDTGIVRNTQNAINLLQRIRYAFKYGKSEEEIIKLLPFNDDVKANISIEFNFKSYPYDSEYDSVASDENKFSLSTNKLLGVTGVDEAKMNNFSAYIPRNKGIYGTIYFKNQSKGAIFETQVYSFPNVLSMLKSLGLENDYNAWLSVGDNSTSNLSEFISDVLIPKMKSTHKNTVEYSNIWAAIRLINIFISNREEIIPLYLEDKDTHVKTKYIPAANLSLTGLSVVSHDKGKEYFDTTDYQFDYQIQDINQILTPLNPVYHTAKAHSFKYDFTINGKTIIQAGKSFILTSENPRYNGMSEEGWLQAYINQELNRSSEYFSDDIKLILITSPASDIKTYVNHLKHLSKKPETKKNIDETDSESKEEITDKNDGLSFLGNRFTNYRLLSLLMKDPRFEQILLEQLKKGDKNNSNDVYDKKLRAIRYLISFLENVETNNGGIGSNEGIKAVKKILINTVSDLYRKNKDYFQNENNQSSVIGEDGKRYTYLVSSKNQRTVGSLIGRLLWQVVFNGGYGSKSNTIGSSIDFDAITNAAIKVFEDKWTQGVYYHIPLDSQIGETKLQINGNTYYLLTLATDDNWKFNMVGEDDKPQLKMTGKLDATMAIGNINPLLAIIDRGMVQNNSGNTSFMDNYLGRNKKEPPKETQIVKSISSLEDFQKAISMLNDNEQYNVVLNLSENTFKTYLKQLLDIDKNAVIKSTNLQQLIIEKLITLDRSNINITWDLEKHLVLVRNGNDSGQLLDYHDGNLYEDPENMLICAQKKGSNLDQIISLMIPKQEPETEQKSLLERLKSLLDDIRENQPQIKNLVKGISRLENLLTQNNIEENSVKSIISMIILQAGIKDLTDDEKKIINELRKLNIKTC